MYMYTVSGSFKDQFYPTFQVLWMLIGVCMVFTTALSITFSTAETLGLLDIDTSPLQRNRFSELHARKFICCVWEDQFSWDREISDYVKIFINKQ